MYLYIIYICTQYIIHCVSYYTYTHIPHLMTYQTIIKVPGFPPLPLHVQQTFPGKFPDAKELED